MPSGLRVTQVRYVRTPADLVTPIDMTQAGFLQQALRKTREASPYVERARQLLESLERVQRPQDLMDIAEIRDDLVTAAGFSDKAANYFSSSQLGAALLEVLQHVQETAGPSWRTEIVYRFLLTRGDTLGGVMRNIMGAEAKARFADAVAEALRSKSISPRITRSAKNVNKIQQISWPGRLLLFDKKPKLIGKNVDAILLYQPETLLSAVPPLESKDNYLLCGEVKGGIDPAGADEHWKTALGALARIRARFEPGHPKLFFVGAAIEDSMAAEIFAQLESGLLDHAANLNAPQQLSDLAAWLVSF